MAQKKSNTSKRRTVQAPDEEIISGFIIDATKNPVEIRPGPNLRIGGDAATLPQIREKKFGEPHELP
jgi:hypothetical protein